MWILQTWFLLAIIKNRSWNGSAKKFYWLCSFLIVHFLFVTFEKVLPIVKPTIVFFCTAARISLFSFPSISAVTVRQMAIGQFCHIIRSLWDRGFFQSCLNLRDSPTLKWNIAYFFGLFYFQTLTTFFLHFRKKNQNLNNKNKA